MRLRRPGGTDVSGRKILRRFASSVVALACLIAVPAAWGGSVLDAMHHFFQDSRTVTADFTQKVSRPDGQVVKRAAGRLWISRPGKFRWTYEGSDGEVIVSNGRKVWLYEPALQQATVQPLGTALSSTPAALIAGRNPLSRQFTVRILPTGPGGLDWVLLLPKEGQSQGFTSIRMGFDHQGRLQEMRMEDAFQQTTTLKFSKIHINGPIASSKFRFSPPPGVDVLTNP